MIAKYTLELNWKEFNISLPALQTWLLAEAGEYFCGLSADTKLKVHFVEAPTVEIIANIQAHWAGLASDSGEATSYQGATEILVAAETDRAAKRASATTKLEALGLTADEVAAILG